MTDTIERQSDWYRNIGDTYAKIAAESDYLPKKAANAAEAAKYYAMADSVASRDREPLGVRS
jgi:hypothetical protein